MKNQAVRSPSHSQGKVRNARAAWPGTCLPRCTERKTRRELPALVGVRDASRLQGREPWISEKLHDLIDELDLTWRKVGYGLAQMPREHTCIDSGRVEGAEPIDESTELASPQEHGVVLDVVYSHRSLARFTRRAASKKPERLYFVIQVNRKKKAAALTAITTKISPIANPSPATHNETSPTQ